MDPSLKRRQRVARAGAQAFIGISAAALLGGCSLPYYWQAVAGQLSLLSKRVPIESVIEDPQTSAQTREALRTVLETRQFAVDELGLPENSSYATYVDLAANNSGSKPGAADADRDSARRERNVAVWTVVAADEFSIDPRTWCYPFAGCVSYRGYFNEAAALRYAARLESEGLDVLVGGATAYSTLGYFADPVTSSMIGGPDYRIVELLIHELAHQKFYLKGDSDLNEAFATAVAEYGTQRWLKQSGDADSLAAYREQALAQTRFGGLILRQRERLRAIYAGPEPPRRNAPSQGGRFRNAACAIQRSEAHVEWRCQLRGVVCPSPEQCPYRIGGDVPILGAGPAPVARNPWSRGLLREGRSTCRPGRGAAARTPASLA